MARILVVFTLLGTVAANGDLFHSISEGAMMRGLAAGHSYVDRLDQIEADLLENQAPISERSSLFKMSQFKKFSPEAVDYSRKGLQLLEMTRSIKEEMSLSVDDVLRLTTASWTPLYNATCPWFSKSACFSSKYRSMTGVCNNLVNPVLGQSFTDYRRVLNPAYADGISSPRVASNGKALTSARNISVALIHQCNVTSMKATLAVMQWGQFINHDMENTPTWTYSNGTAINCCQNVNNINTAVAAASAHPACFAVNVDPNDRFWNQPKFSTTCMSFVRSISGPRNNCSLGYADQLNMNTHWLDGSMIYGSTNATMNTLRTYKNGQLLMSTRTGRSLLPISSPCNNSACFYAGDPRADEQPQLTVMHTVWAREHNRIAAQLHLLNPSWTDEIVFQEARRIVGAQIQHITYDEWLPNLLNSTYLKNYGLLSSAPGFFNGYSSSLTSGPISNEFATAAFRMGHSMVQGIVQLFNSTNGPTSNYSMGDFFFNPVLLANSSSLLDSIIRGLAVQPNQAVDVDVTHDLWNRLFGRRSVTRTPFAFDIVALNIQRGRDHGIPGYNAYRQMCGLPKLTSFNDLESIGLNKLVDKKDLSVLKAYYASVDDIDLYVAGLAEQPSPNSLVGPIFSCLIAENFAALKKSDRYFFEIGGQRNSFTAAQLASIRSTSLARVFCDNQDGSVARLQPAIFVNSNPNGPNAQVPCSQIPGINLNLWKGEPL